MNWTFTGSLPTGLVLDLLGKITGTPTQAGPFTFTINVDDGQGGAGTKNYTVNIHETVQRTLIISPEVLPDGVIGQPYEVQLAANVQSGGFDVFPADHILNTPMDKAPVLANSDAMIAQIKADAAGHETVHPGFEIPVSEGTFPKRMVLFLSPESDAGPYAIPDNAPIEAGGDGHVITRQTDENKLYEIFGYVPGNVNQTGSGAIFDLNGYALRTNGDTSADGAGLPIYPLLLRYAEWAAGEIKHALRVTMRVTRNQGSYAGLPGAGNPPVANWPARHRGNQTNANPNVPGMGERLRLKASFDDSALSPDTKIVTACLKKYGLIVADNGSSLFIQGDTAPGWTPALIDKLTTELRTIRIENFEAIDGVSPFIIDVDSGKAKQL